MFFCVGSCGEGEGSHGYFVDNSMSKAAALLSSKTFFVGNTPRDGSNANSP